MTLTFCRFERSHDLQPVDVDLTQINYLEGRPLTTIIHFNNGEHIAVYGNAISVCKRIQDATYKAPPRPKKKHQVRRNSH